MKYCRKPVACVLLALMLLALLPIAQAEDGVKTEYRQMEVRRGTVTGDAKVNVRTKPNTSSDRAGRLNVGESCVITGESGDWWQVEFEGKTCYVMKGLLKIETVMEEVEVIVEDPMEAWVEGLQMPALLVYRNEYKISGMIKSNIPLTKIVVEIYNLRTLKTDKSATVTMKREENIREFDLADMAEMISFRKTEPGEKRLIIRAESASQSNVLSDTFFYVHASGNDRYTEAVHMTGKCKIRTTCDDRYDLIDGDYASGMEFRSEDDYASVTLPENEIAEGMLVCWKSAPKDVVYEFYGADGELLNRVTESNKGSMIHFWCDLDEKVRRVRIRTNDMKKVLTEIRVYEKGKVSTVIQRWKPLPEKVDILVISAHQDDELLFFGGTIPYYAAQGKKVGVVYMANCSRKRYSEALDGLWACGLEYHPVFIGLKDKNISSYEEAVKLWESMDATENVLVDLIRRYQPDVIVTHDVNGEYGHNQHKITCAAVQSAVTKAGDSTVSPDSAERYGVWTPKKLYIHLYAENPIFMEVYDEPSERFEGMTMTEVATIGYSKHCSQQGAYSMEKQGVKYDNRKYGLVFTTVGQDVEKNDFFENIN